MNLKDQKKIHELYAHYWMTMASTGAATQRNISKGDGRQLTDEEKIKDALDTALRHIHIFSECAENESSFERV